MRALCEGCGKAQPPDWKAGDLCSFCGKTVRHDVRCYWCAKWVPAVKFCRSCGAAVVEETLYGAARMLKDAGTDRFTIPKQLKEFDPDQIENFARIYQRHAVAVARHVDEVRFLERFLFGKVWSAALDDHLVPQLPWPEDTLARMSAPAHPPGDDLATVRTIHDTTPFAETKALAALVRLKLRDKDSFNPACSVFHTDDPALKEEAALQLCDWRVIYSWGRQRGLERELVDTLRKSSRKLDAAVRLGVLGCGKEDALKEALTSTDPETAFAAALVLGDVDRLQVALKGDDQMKAAAGNKLVALGVLKPVIQEIPRSNEEIQQELVESLLRRKEAAPEAAEALIEIVEKTEDDRLRERASRLLCRDLQPGWVLRIARAGKGNHHIYQNLLQAAGLPPEAVVELADFLLENGRFTLNQYGMDKLAENPALPPSYVATRFGRADDKTKIEMIRFAEKQLEKRPSDGLHQFVMKVVFGPHPAELRAAAWGCLHRWYRHQGEHRGEGPFRLQEEQIKTFFGSIEEFVPKLAALLRDHDTLKEVGVYEFIAHLLRSTDAATITAIQQETAAADDLVDALLDAAKGDYWPNTLESIVVLASQLGTWPRWNDKVLTAIRALGKKGSYHYDKAVRRLELSKHGIPEESAWNDVAPEFVTTNFWKADPEGKREFLKLTEHLLIHKSDEEERVPALSRFLLKAAMTLEDPELAGEALEMHAERAPRSVREFRLAKAEVEKGYGPFAGFLEALPKALRSGVSSKERRVLDFYQALFENPKPEDAEMLAVEGDLGHATIRAVLETASAPATGDTPQMILRRDALRWLKTAGMHPKWRDEVVQGLDRLRTTPGTDQKVECDMALRTLRPPEPPKPPPKMTRRPDPMGVDEEDEQPEPMTEHQEATAPPTDYAALGKKAEKMGAELQAKVFMLMAGPGSPEEKMKEATRLSEEFQAAVKKLYGQ